MKIEQISSDGTLEEIDGKIFVKSGTDTDLKIWLEDLAKYAFQGYAKGGKGVVFTDNRQVAYHLNTVIPSLFSEEYQDMATTIQHLARSSTATQFVLVLVNDMILSPYLVTMDEWIEKIHDRVAPKPDILRSTNWRVGK